MIDERTEQLINRKLDNELTAAESLELDKLLIRDPRARVLMEQYARMDEQAGEVIRAVTSAPAIRLGTSETSDWGPPRRQWWYSFALVSSLAAAITLAVLLSQRAASLDVRERPDVVTAQASFAPDHKASPPVDYVWHFEGPRRETLNLERDVIGVWDRHSGSLYLLEADHARTQVEPVKVNY